MPNPDIQFEDDMSPVAYRLRKEQQLQEARHPKMVDFVMQKFHVNENVAQIILIAAAALFFVISIIIFVAHFIL